MRELVEKVAEVVLYEGYLLYPYRQSAMRNQQRWTFGGVYPRAYSEITGGLDPWTMQTQRLILCDDTTPVDIKVRFLHVVDRSLMDRVDATVQAVEELRIGDRKYSSGEEAIEREIVVDGPKDPVTIAQLLDGCYRRAILVPEGKEEESLIGLEGEVASVLVRSWQPLEGDVHVAAKAVDLQHPILDSKDLYRLTVRIANTTTGTWADTGSAERQRALRQTFVSTHTILRIRGGEFVSLLDPPPEYRAAAAACVNDKTWPVLVGEQGEKPTMMQRLSQEEP